MKRFVLAVALACALSSTALAGEVPTTGIVSPPPPDEIAAPGDIPSTEVTSSGDMPTVDQFLLTVLGLVF